MRLLVLAFAVLLAGCALPTRPVTENRSSVSYLTRVSPEAALNSVAVWAATLDDVAAERGDSTLVLRDVRKGETNVARVMARFRADGITEVTVRSQYVLRSQQLFLDLASMVYFGQAGTGTDPFLLAASGEGCTSEADWRASDAPAPRTALTAPSAVPIVETQPDLIGGLEGLMQRVRYPESSRRADIQGMVYTTFVVAETGAVECVQVIGAPDRALAAAAYAAVSASSFTPGTQRGEPVRVRFTLPIRFWLR